MIKNNKNKENLVTLQTYEYIWIDVEVGIHNLRQSLKDCIKEWSFRCARK